MKFRVDMSRLREILQFGSAPRRVWISIYILVFLVSLISWVALPGKTRPTVMFFSRIMGNVSTGELRQVLPGANVEDDAQRIVAEYLLGPVSPQLYSVFSSDSNVRSVLYRKSTLYVDLDEMAILAGDSLKAGLAGLEISLRYGMPGIKNFEITVGGKEPFLYSLQNP